MAKSRDTFVFEENDRPGGHPIVKQWGGESEIQKRINRIKANLDDFNAVKALIVEDMLYLQDHQDQLKQETGKTFQDIITELTGYSKSYFYQLTGNYQFLIEHDKQDLFEKVDTKVIELVRNEEDRKKQKKLLELLEKKVESGESVRRSDFVDKKDHHAGKEKDYKQKPPHKVEVEQTIWNYIRKSKDRKKAAQDLIDYIENLLKKQK